MRCIAVFVCIAVALAPYAHSAAVLDILASNPQFSIFNSYLETTGLDVGLSGNGPYSVFVPTNDAFGALGDWVMNYYNASINIDIMVAFLAYHVVPKALSVTTFIPDQELLTAEGDPVFVEYVHGTTTLGLSSSTCQKDVSFVGSEVQVSNGMVIGINTVMFPQGLACPNKLWWSEGSGSQRVGNLGYDCRSTGFSVYANSTTPAFVKNPSGVAVDDTVQQQVVLWGNDVSTDNTNSSFLSSVFFSGDQMQNVLLNIPDPRGMDIQSTINMTMMFFASHAAHSVYWCAYDGAYLTNFWTGSSNDYPIDVAVDTSAWLLFIAVQTGPGFGSGYLMSISLYQQNATVLVENIAGISGVCLDKVARHAWVTQSSGSVLCYAYGNVTCPTATISGLASPTSCVVDTMYEPYGGPVKIVYASPSTGSIHSVDLSTNAIVALATDMSEPNGVRFACMPPPSMLLATWKIAAVSFADAIVSSTNAMMSTLLPTSNVKIFPTITVQEEPEVICPARLMDYTDYVVSQAKSWSNAIGSITSRALTSADGGQGAFSGMTSAAPTFAKAAKYLQSSNATISGGAGVGFAMSLQCNNTVLFSFGVALGGGFGPSGSSFQGGGAGLTPTATVSGGGNCACSGGTCGSCTGGDAQGSAGNIAGLASAVQAAVASQCAPNTLALCVSGTGSGGWDSNWCEYGAGFGVSFEARVTFNTKGELVEDEAEGSASGSGSGYPPTLLCAVDPQALTINSAVTMCNSECYGTPDFNACYCPCFSSFLSANGVAWASNISC